MLNKVLQRVFGTKNEREIKRLKKKVEKINQLEEYYSKMEDDDLRKQTEVFKNKLAIGENIENILEESFAVVREASKRVLGMRHYDVQLLGGIILHEGKITEMKTGEGKTLVATCPIYLNSLTGKGVHIITVNDYLAKRDRELMKPLFDFLGISSGLIEEGLSTEERQIAYQCDITYGTNSQFGFDYLRDNMITSIEDRVQRGFNYCIIDEIDSILIDEARTPLIISNSGGKASDIYDAFYTISSFLDRSYKTEKLLEIGDIKLRKEKLKEIKSEDQKDYDVDEKNRNIIFRDKGIAKVEKLLGKKNIYSSENIELLQYLKQAVIAKEFYHKNKEYIIRDGEIVIIDNFTGRAMEGRRFGEGLHQALEAKEGLEVKEESKTLASITLQSYFKFYSKLSGMTGTAETEAVEFENTYGLKVIVVPTNKPIQRKDYEDSVYRTNQEKIEAIIKKVKEVHTKGQPILIGTSSINSSENLSKLLEAEGIEHKVLNAKFHAKEAEIISQAGRYGAVTIATNMAGRGTDILLGGNPEVLAKQEVGENKSEEYFKVLEKYKEICKKEKEVVRELGGLFILGTERHDSRRIDNQLRGRAGRQGDVGESQFYLSFEDTLMVNFGATKLLEKIKLEYGEEIKDKLLTRAIEKAQQNVEVRNFSIRKNLLEYDEVVNNQRKAFYRSRNEILENREDIRGKILGILKEVIKNEIEKRFVGEYKEEWDILGVANFLKENYDYELKDLEEYKYRSIEEYEEIVFQKIEKHYKLKEEELGAENLRYIERDLFFKRLDQNWQNHINNLVALKSGIHLRSYGQKNPLIDYKITAGELFDQMILRFKEEITSYIFKVKLLSDIKEEKKVIEIKADGKCSCGSGKAPEKCCLREAKRIF